mmetsp:Transcript_3583/g.12644  ORF Transcript_3583/g.12644 Transcript_3583/m.12644 type:complete len:410 (+) Transcript_3583:39-1268(+)
MRCRGWLVVLGGALFHTLLGVLPDGVHLVELLRLLEDHPVVGVELALHPVHEHVRRKADDDREHEDAPEVRVRDHQREHEVLRREEVGDRRLNRKHEDVDGDGAPDAEVDEEVPGVGDGDDLQNDGDDGNGAGHVAHEAEAGGAAGPKHRLVGEEQDRAKEEDQRVPDGGEHPSEERRVAKERAALHEAEGLWVVVDHALADVLLEDRVEERRHRREEDVEERHDPVVVDRGGRVAAVESEPELDEEGGGVLVDRILDEARVAEEAVAAVDGDETLEVAELADGIVGRASGLRALLAKDADANVRLQDHADVVGAVADREAHLVRVCLHVLDDLCLLDRRHSAADHRVTLGSQLQEARPELLVESKAERRAVDDHRQLLLLVVLLLVVVAVPRKALLDLFRAHLWRVGD